MARRILLPLLLLPALPVMAFHVRAESNATVAVALQTGTAYISPQVKAAGRVHRGDLARLRRAADASGERGVPEKFAIVRHLPSNYGAEKNGAALAAQGLARLVGLVDGVMIVVSPRGLGLSSSRLDGTTLRRLERRFEPLCRAVSYTACALQAGRAAIVSIGRREAAATRNAALVWFAVLVLLAAVIAWFVWRAARLQRRLGAGQDALRAAAGSTLALADAAVREIEVVDGMNQTDVRAEYTRAREAQERARREIESGTTPAALTQANTDAALAVLILQRIGGSLGLEGLAQAGSSDRPVKKCLYCARAGMSSYVERSIDDSQGNGLRVDVCPSCIALLESGQTPAVAVARHGGSRVPWWADPASGRYVAYGGAAWQYWLPFLIGVDVAGWYRQDGAARLHGPEILAEERDGEGA